MFEVHVLDQCKRVALVAVIALSSGLLVAACSSGSATSPTTTSVPTLTLQETLSKAITASTSGNYGTATNLLNQVIAEDPRNSKSLGSLALYNLGVVQQQQGKTSEAIASYKKAVALNPVFTSALYNLAIAETTTNPAAALASYNTILKLKPSDVNSLFNSGLLMYNMGDTTGGSARIKQAIILNPALASRVPASVQLKN